MNVLSLNPGSSTLKYTLFRGEEPLANATIEVKQREGRSAMTEATAEVLRSVGEKIDAVGCRVVHGGSRFLEPALVDDRVVAAIRELGDIAPLHNPLAAEVIEEVRRTLRDVPVVAVFDTTFHQTMPAVASTYAIPRDFGVKRYGFHGISYAYVASRLSRPRMIACHLGNGASICAMRDGRSIDTSMGFTPMEGLLMGTRAGDIDPGVILYLMRHGKREPELDDLLNRRSGLLAVSGKSGDVRELEIAAKGGDPRAELGLEMFAYRVAKYIGAYSVALGGVDAVVFTAGIGEHSSSMRARICKRLSFLGIQLHEARNEVSSKQERCISSGPVEVWVIPTNEELEIARAVASTLKR
ncbi:MAG: acetate/propionate family kinase [Thermoanaerobaculia bacterium]